MRVGLIEAVWDGSGNEGLRGSSWLRRSAMRALTS